MTGLLLLIIGQLRVIHIPFGSCGMQQVRQVRQVRLYQLLLVIPQVQYPLVGLLALSLLGYLVALAPLGYLEVRAHLVDQEVRVILNY